MKRVPSPRMSSKTQRQLSVEGMCSCLTTAPPQDQYIEAAALQGFNTPLKHAVGPQSSQAKEPEFFIIMI